MKKQLFKTVLIAMTFFLAVSCSNDDANEIIDDQPSADNILTLFTNNEALENVYYVDIDGEWHASPINNNGTSYESIITNMQLVSYVKVKTANAVTVHMSLNGTNSSPLLDENSCYKLFFNLNEDNVMILGDFIKIDCSN